MPAAVELDPPPVWLPFTPGLSGWAPQALAASTAKSQMEDLLDG
jgi:hypothetical protein